MLPVWLVGILAVLCLCQADVKHVLDGSAHLPPCYHEQQNEAVPGSVAFWWADANSPFKQAYEYFKKCSSKEKCLPPIAPSFQVPVPAQSTQTQHFQQNAFLNGQVHASAPTPKIDLSQNPFLNKGMQAAYSSTGQAVTTGSDGFLGVQPSVPFAKNNQEQCVCTDKKLCSQENIITQKQSSQCDAATQVCCRLSNSAFAASTAFTSSYSNLSHVATGKSSSGSVIKFDGGAGLSPGSIQIISDEAPIPNPLLNKGGSSPSNSIKVIRNTYNTKNVFASTIDYTNDNLAELSFDSAFQGPQYLPPIDSPSKPPVFTVDLQPPVTTSVNEYLPPVSSTPPTISVHVPTESNVNTQYVFPPETSTPPQVIYSKPSTTAKPTPGYSYPQPTPSFVYPSTIKPFIPIKVPQKPITPYVPKPSVTPFIPQPSITPFIPHHPITPFLPNPSITPFLPVPIPSVTPFRPSPSSIKPLPTPIIPSQSNINNNYITPKPSKPVHPVKGGYSYPTPHPPFTVPSYQPLPSNTGTVIIQTPKPTPRPTINQYLPPIIRPTPDSNLETGESSNGGNFVRPPHVPQPNEPVGSVAFPHGSCAAALKCVQEIYCTAEGIISPTPVVLSKDQEFLRVPTTECFDRQAGIIGKCCRDPNYVDPWPSANSLNGFDDGQYKEDPRLGQYFPQAYRSGRSGVKRQAIDNTCGIRHERTVPRGQGIEVNFSEIPWQAMVLRDSNRTLLCGGSIIRSNVVLTAAHCIEGSPTDDILVKGGEWKLGIDDEPLPYQIVKVAAIVRHPQYIPGGLKNDLALLILSEHLRITKNIAPICLPTPNQAPLQQCIVTGWGKRVLQVHLRGAIMKSINVNILDPNQCQYRLSRYNLTPEQYEPVFCGISNNDQCDVDYGSALACTSGNGQYTLMGIFSWDTGCKDPEQLGGYIPADVEWIETTSAKSLTELKTLEKQYSQ